MFKKKLSRLSHIALIILYLNIYPLILALNIKKCRDSMNIVHELFLKNSEKFSKKSNLHNVS